MSVEQMDYAAILANLEAKRAALDATITSIRTAIASGVLGQVGEIPQSANGGSGAYSPMMGGSNEIPAGAFLGKSIPDAAKLYLEIVKKKQTSREISEALQKGGMESTSRNFQQIVHSILDRTRKANGGIVKLDRSYWGLAAWYPAGLQRSAGGPQEKRTAAHKKAKKPKPSRRVNKAVQSPAAVTPRFPLILPTAPTTPEVAVVKPKGIDVRVMELLNFSAPNGTIGREVAAALGEPVGVVNFSLVRLAKKGSAVRGEDGRYFAAKEPE